MKTWLLCALLVASVSAAEAQEIIVSSGTTPSISTSGSLYSNSNYDGWNITVVAGSNFSPTLSPFGLDLSVLATCTSGACLSSPLAVYYTVQNYTATVPAGGLQETFSTAQTGASAASATSWADSTNALYAGSEPAGNLIGTVGTFSAPGGIGTVDGGSSQTSSTPYSLTLEELFNADGAIASFSANGNITSAPSPVPVPPSLALLGSGLLAAILLGRRSRTFRV